MDLSGSRILILGGTGLVGTATARELLAHGPQTLVLSGLARHEAESAVESLHEEADAAGVQLVPEWGDIFAPHDLKDRSRSDVLADAVTRGRLLDDLYAVPAADAVEQSALGAMLLRHRPQVIIDCINTATVFAYQNVFASALELREQARGQGASTDAVERHLATLYLPQLIRHVQLALEGMMRVGTRTYVKVGTAGTGGMGLNIPFTHSEKRPSRMLLAKASVAGAHTLLLFLMARTPGAPAVKEIKPTAAIAWKRIGYGEVTRAGRPLQRVDALHALPVEEAFSGKAAAEPAWRETGEALRGVYLDAGENGLFSLGEFEALTALGLMEFITPEEIARDVVREIRGSPTGRDVVGALDAATSGPTYRAGVLRQHAIDRMEALEEEQGLESVAYEMLGPPRLSKLLFEAAILSRMAGGEMETAARMDPAEAARSASALLEEDSDLRTRILSIGLPVLLPDSTHILRGADVKVHPDPSGGWERSAANGWVDLRAANWERWRERIRVMTEAGLGPSGADDGSRHDLEAWKLTGRIRPGALAAWVFRHEDAGERIKR